MVENVGRKAGHFLPFEQDRAGGRLIFTADNIEEGRLSCSIGPMIACFSFALTGKFTPVST